MEPIKKKKNTSDLIYKTYKYLIQIETAFFSLNQLVLQYTYAMSDARISIN